MAYRALKTFTGLITMVKGEVREIKDEALAKDLVKSGYVVSLSDKKSEKKVPEVTETEQPKTAKGSRAKKAKGGES